jgi:hypothetical protein
MKKKVRCPKCKTLLQVDVPEPNNLFDKLFGNFGKCEHPDNVKVNGKCLACERERK